MAQYAKNVYPMNGGFSYDILSDGVKIIHQDFHPDLDGFQAMDEATANACADIVIARLQAA